MIKKMRIACRFLRSWICFLVFGFGALLLSGIFFPPAFIFLREKNRRRRYFVRVIRVAWRVMLGRFRAFFLADSKLCPDATVFEKMRGNVVVANHPTLIDILFLVVSIPHSVCIVKNSLARNPFVAVLVRNAFLPNDVPFSRLLENSQKLLNAGFNLVVFPEMTRTRLHTPSQVHTGAFHIALHARAPISFVKIVPSERILAKEQPLGYAGTRFVAFDLVFRERTVPAAETALSHRVQARELAEKFRNLCLS